MLLMDNSSATLRNCRLSRNKCAGIVLLDSAAGELHGNTIAHNEKCGIVCAGRSSASVVGNAVLGGNGTGKATLLRALSGLLPTWSGEILFDGQNIASARPDRIVRAGLVQVTQGKEAYPAMTVEENLKVGAFTRRDKAAVAADLKRVYEFFPVLAERRKQLSGTLSGGEV